MNVYRPPQSTPSSFYSKLADLLSAVVTNTDRVVLCGDFNCPGGSSTIIDPDLSVVLNTFGLTQHVNEPTRNDNLLDLIATDSSLAVDNCSVADVHSVSDHRLVVASLAVLRPPRRVVTVTLRRLQATSIWLLSNGQ